MIPHFPHIPRLLLLIVCLTIILLPATIGANYIISRKAIDSTFLDDINFTPYTGENGKAPGPTFPFYFFGEKVSPGNIVIHHHGSVHFNPMNDYFSQCCAGSCDLSCNLGIGTQRRLSPSIIPYSNSAMYSYQYTQSIYSTQTEYAVRTTMSLSGTPMLSYIVTLIYPSTVIIIWEPRDDAPPDPSDDVPFTNIFSGLVTPRFVRLNPSPHFQPGKTYPQQFILPPTQAIALKEKILERGYAYTYCAVGSHGCLTLSHLPRVITEPRKMYFTVNSDASCFKPSTSPILQKIFPTPNDYPSVGMQIWMYSVTGVGETNWSQQEQFFAIATYNQDTNVFECTIPDDVIQSSYRYGTATIQSIYTYLVNDDNYQAPLQWNVFTPRYSWEYIESYHHFYNAYHSIDNDIKPLEDDGLLLNMFDLQRPTDHTVDPICTCSPIRFGLTRVHGYSLQEPQLPLIKDDYCYFDCSGTRRGDEHYDTTCGQCSTSSLQPNCARLCVPPPYLRDLCIDEEDDGDNGASTQHNPNTSRTNPSPLALLAQVTQPHTEPYQTQQEHTGQAQSPNPDRLSTKGFTTDRYYISYAIAPLHWFKAVMLILITTALGFAIYLTVMECQKKRKARNHQKKRKNHKLSQPPPPPPPPHSPLQPQQQAEPFLSQQPQQSSSLTTQPHHQPLHAEDQHQDEGVSSMNTSSSSPSPNQTPLPSPSQHRQIDE